jgi:hypothetical protein
MKRLPVRAKRGTCSLGAIRVEPTRHACYRRQGFAAALRAARPTEVSRMASNPVVRPSGGVPSLLIAHHMTTPMPITDIK